jgi:hypothetical protein
MVKRRMLACLLVVGLALLMVVPSLYAAEYKADFKEWKTLRGKWKVDGDAYENSDTTDTNTNAYFALAQDGTEFVYEWTVTFGKTTDPTWGPIAGLHFLCSDYKDPNNNRGNSYLVLQDKINYKIYKTTFGNLVSIKSFPLTAKSGDTYSFRVEFNSKTGLMKLYRDGKFIGEWQDPAPIKSGKYISLRTNCTVVTYKDLKVTAK